MSLMDGGILSLMTQKLSYLGQRESVLAQNVANANTPGYKAKDLTPFGTFAEALKSANTGAGMVVTDAKHIVPASMAGVNASSKKAHSYETVPSGNSVDLEQQMMEVSKTTMEYQADASIYHKFMGLLRVAIGK